jgi:hypothetical protein
VCVHLASLHGVALFTQHLRDGVDDPSLSWMGGPDRCPGGSGSGNSSILGRVEASSAVAGCIIEQSLQWCWGVGVVSTKVHSLATEGVALQPRLGEPPGGAVDVDVCCPIERQLSWPPER